MRSFSDTEKSILRFMAYPHKPQDTCIISLLDKFSDCYLIEWPEDYSFLELIYAKDKNGEDVRNKVFDIIVLLDYLECNKYIGVFRLSSQKDNQIYNREKFDVVKDEKDNILLFAKETLRLNITIPNKKSIKGNYYCRTLITTSKLKEYTTAAKQIEKYASSSFHVTQTLRDFVDNKFQTKEDLRYNETKMLTWIALWTSMGIGIGGIIVSLLDLFIK